MAFWTDCVSLFFCVHIIACVMHKRKTPSSNKTYRGIGNNFTCMRMNHQVPRLGRSECESQKYVSTQASYVVARESESCTMYVSQVKTTSWQKLTSQAWLGPAKRGTLSMGFTTQLGQNEWGGSHLL